MLPTDTPEITGDNAEIAGQEIDLEMVHGEGELKGCGGWGGDRRYNSENQHTGQPEMWKVAATAE